MLSDEFPEYGGKAPDALGGSPVSLHVYMEDVDAFVKKAVAAGPRSASRSWISSTATGPASSKTPFGHLWWVATHKEGVALEEMQRRVEAMFAGRK